MRNALIIVAAAVTLASQVSGQEPAAPAPKKIEITFEGNGVMSLMTTNAPLREILNEWTRKGGTPFPGSERLSGAPLTLELPHKSETEVIASLLRSASGYVVSARKPGSTAASSIEVVYVLATSTATTGGYSPAPAYVPPPQPQPTTQGNPDSEVAPVAPGRSGQAGTAGAPPPDAPPPPRPSGVSGVAVPVITVPVPTSTRPTPTPTPPATPGTGARPGGGEGR